MSGFLSSSRSRQPHSSPGRLGDLGEPLGADLGEMQALGQRMGGASLGADAAAPAGADDRYVYLLHETLQVPLRARIIA